MQNPTSSNQTCNLVLYFVLAYAISWSIGIPLALKHQGVIAGYPMSGILIGVFGLLARDLYPADEPELSPATHIRRALGGPIVNALLSVLFFLLLPLWPGDWYWRCGEKRGPVCRKELYPMRPQTSRSRPTGWYSTSTRRRLPASITRDKLAATGKPPI